MIELHCVQGDAEWLQGRAGACTASRFEEAISRVGGLDERQAAYVAALKAGVKEAEALAIAEYKKTPTAAGIRRALAGEQVDMPSDLAIRYAWLLGMERIAEEPLDDTFVTYAMRRGRELEPIARAKYEARFGVAVTESGILLTDDRLYGYSTDGQVYGQPGGVEIKCPMAADKLGTVWEHPETAEAEYISQIDGGMWLSAWEWIDLVVYCPWLESVGKDLFTKRIWRDDDRIEKLESGLVEFTRMSQRFEAILRQERPTVYERRPARQKAEVISVSQWAHFDATPVAQPAEPVKTKAPAANLTIDF